jgi:hypothetical protein
MEMTTSGAADATSPKDPESGINAATAAASTMPSWLKWLRWAILAIGVILFGCGIWAIVDSLLVTNNQIKMFWNLVDTVDQAQAKISTELADLNGQVGVLKNATQQLNVEADKIQGILYTNTFSYPHYRYPH